MSETPSILPVPPRVHRSVIGAIAAVFKPGPALTIGERAAVAHLARTPRYWHSASLSTADIAWVRQLVDDPGGSSSETVAWLFPEGAPVVRLAEILQVAAQIRAIDTYSFAVGMRQVSLTSADEAPRADSITLESTLRDSWYLDRNATDDLSATVEPLDRLTVEYVAGLVSYLNESTIDMATHASLLRRADTAATLAADGLRLERFATGSVDVDHAGLIANFVRAAHDRDGPRMVVARVDLVAARDVAFAAAVASVHAAFEMMNRLTLGVVTGLGPQLSQRQANQLLRQVSGPTDAYLAEGLVELGFGPADLGSLNPVRLIDK